LARSSKLLDALAQILHRVELSENGEVLPHREPHRHVDIGAFEIHAAEHIGAFLRHRMAKNLDAAGGRQHQPHDHGDRRGLAGAVAAEQAGNAAAPDPERHVVDGAGGLVDLDQMRDVDRGLIGRGRRGRRCLAVVHLGRSLSHCGGQRKNLVMAGHDAENLHQFVIAPPHG
jgi:hypothetical protein